MRSLGKIWASILCAAVLAGCQTVGTPNADKTIDLSQKSSGLVVVAVTVAGYLPGVVWYQIVNLANTQMPAVSITSNVESFGLDWNPGQLEGKTFIGRLAVVELPLGEYELRRWVMQVGNTATYASRQPLQYRFSIGRGDIVYLGNVHTDFQQSASAASLPYATKISDQRARDLPLLLQKYPAIKTAMVTVAVPQAAEVRGSGGGTIDGLRDLLRN